MPVPVARNPITRVAIAASIVFAFLVLWIWLWSQPTKDEPSPQSADQPIAENDQTPPPEPSAPPQENREGKSPPTTPDKGRGEARERRTPASDLPEPPRGESKTETPTEPSDHQTPPAAKERGSGDPKNARPQVPNQENASDGGKQPNAPSPGEIVVPSTKGKESTSDKERVKQFRSLLAQAKSFKSKGKTKEAYLAASKAYSIELTLSPSEKIQESARSTLEKLEKEMETTVEGRHLATDPDQTLIEK